MPTIEISPDDMERVLKDSGLSAKEIAAIGLAFLRKNDTIDDCELVEILHKMGKDIYTIISVFESIGMGQESAIILLEHIQNRGRLGAHDTHTLEVV